jgi:hypothetical protein
MARAASVAAGDADTMGGRVRPLVEVSLLVGIPLTVAFQLLVRRRPLRELWVFARRRSGNLAIPAAAHGFIDAVRDGLRAAL